MIQSGIQTRSSETYTNLRLAIERGDLAPGSKLVERDVCDLLGVSRSTLRTAIHRLASEGLVTLAPRRGAYVARLNSEEASDVMEVREVLEGLAAAKAAARAGSTEVEVMHRILAQMELALEGGDFYEYNSLNRQLHDVIVRTAANCKLVVALDSMRVQLVQLQLRGLLMPGRARHSLEEHRRIVAAIQRKDVDTAEKAAREHVRNIREAMLLALSRKV